MAEVVQDKNAPVPSEQKNAPASAEQKLCDISTTPPNLSNIGYDDIEKSDDKGLLLSVARGAGLGKEKDGLRAAAVRRVADLGGLDTVPPLLDLLKDKTVTVNVRDAALFALTKLVASDSPPGRNVVSAFKGVLQDSSESSMLRYDAATALRLGASESDRKELHRQMTRIVRGQEAIGAPDDENMISAETLRASCAPLAGQSVAKDILRVVGDTKVPMETRRAMAESLGEIRDPHSAESIIKLLRGQASHSDVETQGEEKEKPAFASATKIQGNDDRATKDAAKNEESRREMIRDLGFALSTTAPEKYRTQLRDLYESASNADVRGVAAKVLSGLPGDGLAADIATFSHDTKLRTRDVLEILSGAGRELQTANADVYQRILGEGLNAPQEKRDPQAMGVALRGLTEVKPGDAQEMSKRICEDVAKKGYDPENFPAVLAALNVQQKSAAPDLDAAESLLRTRGIDGVSALHNIAMQIVKDHADPKKAAQIFKDCVNNTSAVNSFRIDALEKLSELDPKRAATVREKLGDSDKQIITTLADRELLLSGHNPDRDKLLAVVANSAEDSGDIRRALHALEPLATPETDSALKNLLHAKNFSDESRGEIALALAHRGQAEGYQTLSDLLKRPNLQESIVTDLAITKDPHAMDLVFSALESSDPILSSNARVGLRTVYSNAESRKLFRDTFHTAASGTDDNSDRLPHMQNYDRALADAEKFGIEHPYRFSPEVLGKITEQRSADAAGTTPNPKAPVTLVIFPKSDDSAAFTSMNSSISSLFQQGNHVRFFEAGSDQDARAILQNASTRGEKADTIILGGHGAQTELSLGTVDPAKFPLLPSAETLDTRDLQEWKSDSAVAASLKRGGNIVLVSCFTGSGGKGADNLANSVRDCFPQAKHVFAPRLATTLRGFMFDQNGRVNGVDYSTEEYAG